jgi:aspartyl-tRNA(Asn)/glutamyl-tRNA(Gln) amidotransferase subunit C
VVGRRRAACTHDDDGAPAGLNHMDIEIIRHVAKLAELSLGPEEETKMAAEIGTILDYVKELEAVDTSGVPPTAHVGVSGAEDVWRPDEALPCLTHEEALREAPEAEHGGFVVPTFVGS